MTQNLENGGGRCRRVGGQADREPPEADRVGSVNILLGRDMHAHIREAKAGGQRGLADNAVYCRIARQLIEAFDDRGRIGTVEHAHPAGDADLRCRPLDRSDIPGSSLVIGRHCHGEGRNRASGYETGYPDGNLSSELGRDSSAVNLPHRAILSLTAATIWSAAAGTWV